MQRFNTSFQILISYQANFNNKVHVNYEGIGGPVGRPSWRKMYCLWSEHLYIVAAENWIVCVDEGSIRIWVVVEQRF